MVPLGISSAGAVSVGQAIGRGDPLGARLAGRLALGLGACFMLAAGLIFFTAPRVVLGVFASDAQVLAVGSSLLFIAAVFQLFDGLQVVATGNLRGLGDTRTPMLVNLVGHWLMGLPLAYLLCFVQGWGVYGLWIGLSLGLIFAGIVLLAVWERRAAAVTMEEFRAAPELR